MIDYAKVRRKWDLPSWLGRGAGADLGSIVSSKSYHNMSNCLLTLVSYVSCVYFDIETILEIDITIYIERDRETD